MNQIKKAQLQIAKDYCDDEDKSTEFMLQYMQDMGGASLDEVLDFLEHDAK